MYYLKNRNLHSCFHKYLTNASTDFRKIGDRIEALQISKRPVQTTSYYLNSFGSYFTLNEMIPFEIFIKPEENLDGK